LKRITTALLGLPVFFWIIKYLPPWVFMALVAVAVMVGSYEYYAMAEKRGVRPVKLLGALLGAGVAYTFFDSRIQTIDVLCLAAILVPVLTLMRKRVERDGIEGELGAMATTFFPIVFLGLLMGYCPRMLDDGGERGRDLVVFLFLVVWLADAAAFAVGSLLGRHKLMQSVSPGKTVEGAVGALTVAVLAALVARAWFFRSLGYIDAVCLGLLLGGAGMLGDLAESLIKRSGAVKDSGSLFPGHGGLLDRADSLLFAAPVLFYYHRYFIQ
jgi:phosphatidate cytidylyltransferase